MKPYHKWFQGGDSFSRDVESSGVVDCRTHGFSRVDSATDLLSVLVGELSENEILQAVRGINFGLPVILAQPPG